MALSPEQIYDDCLKRARLPERSVFDWDTETPQQHARNCGRAGYADERDLSRAWRFAALCDARSCLEAMRGSRAR